MAARRRQHHSAEFKAKVALAAIRGYKTLAQLSSEFKISSVQISQWKKRLIQDMPDLFQRKGHREKIDPDALIAPLYQEIGRLKMELDWLKKKVDV